MKTFLPLLLFVAVTLSTNTKAYGNFQTISVFCGGNGSLPKPSDTTAFRGFKAVCKTEDYCDIEVYADPGHPRGKMVHSKTRQPLGCFEDEYNPGGTVCHIAKDPEYPFEGDYYYTYYFDGQKKKVPHLHYLGHNFDCIATTKPFTVR